jgi:hypothetical protein
VAVQRLIFYLKDDSQTQKLVQKIFKMTVFVPIFDYALVWREIRYDGFSSDEKCDHPWPKLYFFL